MGDIFESLFGGRQRQGKSGRTRKETWGIAQKGPQVSSNLEVELMDAILGRELQIIVPIEGEKRNLKVKIPRGIEDGKKVRLKGQGAKSDTGGPPGDLLIEIKIKRDKEYERVGNDLIKEARITIGEAYNGVAKEIGTPWGKVKVNVPPGTQGGRKLRLKGKGVKNGSKMGDLYVQVDIEIPRNRDIETKELIDKLEKCY